MKVAVVCGGQSIALGMEDYLEAEIKAYYGQEAMLIRTAVGGSLIDEWKKGEPNYNAAVAACLAAIAGGYTIIHGVWDHGQSDAQSVELASTWSIKYCKNILLDFRQDIGLPFLRFVHSVLGPVPAGQGVPDGLYPGWLIIQKAQVNILYGRKNVERVDMAWFGPYAAGEPYCHYTTEPTGYPAIAKEFMGYIKMRTPAV